MAKSRLLWATSSNENVYYKYYNITLKSNPKIAYLEFKLVKKMFYHKNKIYGCV